MSTTPEVPAYGGCLWPIDPACETSAWTELEPAIRERALALASSTLQRLTGYRVGTCPVTVRPAVRRRACFFPPSGSGSAYPYLDARGSWMNLPPTQRPVHCQVALPPPVGSITEVKVDGLVVPYADYRIDNGNLLTWMGSGECPWPEDQDVTLPDTEPGTFSVTYQNSYPVDALGAYAAGVLALEFAKACTGGKCRLPSGVTTIARQGVTYEIAGGMFEGGFTGIKEVDSYIALWNPGALRSDSKVLNVDLAQARIRTVEPPGAVYDGGTP